VITAVPVELLPDAALAADIVDGLALVEKSLGEAAHAEEALLSEASRHLIDASDSGRPSSCSPPSSATPVTSGSSPRRWRSN